MALMFTLLAEHFFQANPSACTMSFASPVLYIAGLFTCLIETSATSRLDFQGRKQAGNAKYQRMTLYMLKDLPESLLVGN